MRYRFLFLLFTSLSFFSCKKNKTLFQKVAASSSGIEFENTITENDSISIFKNIYVFNGGGVAIGDLNNDGLQDIYFTGNQTQNKLYLNRGNLRFEDISQISNTEKKGSEWSFGVSMVDINNDGKLDIYVCNSMNPNPGKRRNLLFVNQGNDADKNPVFKELAKEYGIDDPSNSNNAQFFDYDQDGDLDLYIAVSSSIRKYENQFITSSENFIQPNTDVLLENVWSDSLQHPYFKDVSKQAGIVIGGYSNSTLIADINSDNMPDIYVANDFLSSDIFYQNTKNPNNGKNIFENKIASIFKHQSYSAMGSDLADVNNDGKLDFVTTEMLPYYNKRKKLFLNANNYTYYINTEKYNYQYQFLRNTLQINRGKNPETGQQVFSDCSFFAGVHETDWSWTPLLADFDNNGFKDLFISNGFFRDINDHDWGAFRTSIPGTSLSNDQLTKTIPQVKTPNFVFKNYGDLYFEDVSKSWGLSAPSFSNGSAYADLDNDGDLELVTNNINEKAFLYKNLSQEDAHENKVKSGFIRFSLKDAPKNIDAIGSKLSIFYDNGKTQIAQILTARGYLSQSETVIHFGIGNVNKIDSVSITWPDGKLSAFYSATINKLNIIHYSGAADNKNISVQKEGLFKTVSPASLQLDYKHNEIDFCDFNIQRTLPHKLSQYTPPMAVGDLNGDGLDDVFLGGSSQQPDVIYFQHKNAEFLKNVCNAFKKDGKLREENTSILIFDADNDEDNDVYITRGSYENFADSVLYQDELLVNDGHGNFTSSETALESIYSCTTTIKAVDFDGDGDLDLFVGGRVEAKAYPKAAHSYLLRNDTKEKDKPKFSNVTKLWCPQLENIGMISDAIWSDFDNDNRPDLILAGEWMPLTFLKNTGNKLINISSQTGISDKLGWWNSISAADFDNDGDIDYMAGNLGKNTFFNCNKEEPLSIYAKDFDNNGLYDPFVSSYCKDSLGERHEYFYNTRDDMIKQLVLIRRKFKTYGEFGDATVQDVFTKEEMLGVQKLQANWMMSSYIENLGNGKFKITALPGEAQYAPVYATMPYDVDEDGLIDLLMVGNDYGMELLQGRADAFYGLVLKNLGGNKFKSLTLDESHFFVAKDAKALSRINLANGKELIIATQNRDSLKLLSPKLSYLKSIKIQSDEVKARITFTNNQTQLREFYWGSSFISQEPRIINWTKNFKNIIFYNQRNQVTRKLAYNIF